MRLILIFILLASIIQCSEDITDDLIEVEDAETKYDSDFLVDELDADDWRIREAALIALSRLNNKKTVEEIKERLSDPEPHVRIAAIEALRVIDEENSIEDIVKMLKDSDSRVRLYAMDAVHRSKVKGKKALIYNIYRYDSSPFLRTWAESILKKDKSFSNSKKLSQIIRQKKKSI